MKNQIKLLQRNGLRIDWIMIDCVTGEKIHYHTNKFGHGAWIDEGYEKQILGTCDFRLNQKTFSGMRKAIHKYFG